jgi:hypothetical protein
MHVTGRTRRGLESLVKTVDRRELTDPTRLGLVVSDANRVETSSAVVRNSSQVSASRHLFRFLGSWDDFQDAQR